MAVMQQKTFARPDETRKFDKGLLELVTLGGVTFGRGTFQPGWRWSTSVKPLVKTRSCEAPHLQYHVSGRLHVVMDDGSEAEFGPGEVSLLPRPRRLGGRRRAGRRHRHQRDGRLRQGGMTAAAGRLPRVPGGGRALAGRTIAIGDIHGCRDALAALIDAIGPGPDDTLVTLGDHIDRGPDSRGVIDQLLALASRCRLVPLLGDHEEMVRRVTA
jgi:hypothetical protein